MTGELRPWLPAQAVESAAVRARVESAIAEWSAHWVAKGRVWLCGWGLGAAATPAPEEGWRQFRGLRLNCPERSLSRLIGLSLDARLEYAELNARDAALTAGLGEGLLDDLVRRLERLMRLDRSPSSAVPEERTVWGTVSDAQGTLLWFTAPAEPVLDLARAVLPAARRGRAPMGNRRAAAGPTEVRLTATLGRATVSLSELRDLGVGDILLLDRALREPAEIRIAGTEAVVAHGSLTEADGRMALVLQPSSPGPAP